MMQHTVSIEQAKEKLQAFIRAEGLKQTRQREEILEAFIEAGGHLSIEELLKRTAARSPGIGPATLYRTMKLFVDAGWLLKVTHGLITSMNAKPLYVSAAFSSGMSCFLSPENERATKPAPS